VNAECEKGVALVRQLQKDEKVLDSVKGSMLSRMDFLDLE
jgi:hypothetical protein